MKKVLISALFLVIATLALHAQTTHHVVKLGEFTRLVVTDDINVVYRCDADSAGLAVFDCTEDIADRFVFSINKNGRLNIQFNGEYQQTYILPTVIVYSSTLLEVENAGDSTLRVSGLPALEAFKVRNIDSGKVIVNGVHASKLELQIMSGKGKIIADGSCDDLALRMVGTGEIQADRVIATQVTCRIMGTGSLGCNVNGGELKVSGSGTGKVYYKGNPSKVTVHKLGTIKAIPMQ